MVAGAAVVSCCVAVRAISGHICGSVCCPVIYLDATSQDRVEAMLQALKAFFCRMPQDQDHGRYRSPPNSLSWHCTLAERPLHATLYVLARKAGEALNT